MSVRYWECKWDHDSVWCSEPERREAVACPICHTWMVRVEKPKISSSQLIRNINGAMHKVRAELGEI